jgi:hypothetical protein
MANSCNKYFGYFWTNNEDLPKINSYCNCSFIDNSWVSIISDNSYSDIQTLIKKDIESLICFRSNGMKAIIHVSGIFYKDLTKKTVFDTNIWDNNWNIYWKSIYPYLDVVLAFYLDEPDLITLKNVGNLYIIRNNINTLNSVTINNTIINPSDIHIFICLTASMVIGVSNKNYTIPDTIDWIAFDEYDCWDSDTCYFNISFYDKVKILNSTYPCKKILLIGNGSISIPDRTPNRSASITTEEDLIELNKKIYNIHKSLPNFIGMLVFAYNLSISKTVNKLPLLENSLKIIGKEIIRK